MVLWGSLDWRCYIINVNFTNEPIENHEVRVEGFDLCDRYDTLIKLMPCSTYYGYWESTLLSNNFSFPAVFFFGEDAAVLYCKLILY